jgi:hypothetical protein
MKNYGDLWRGSSKPMQQRCVSILGSIVVVIGCARGEDVTIPQEVARLIDIIVRTETKDMSITIAPKSILSKERCSFGVVSFGSLIAFELFPGAACVRLHGPRNPKWLYISLDSENPNEMVAKANDGRIVVRQSVSDKILAVASGMAGYDLTGAPPCIVYKQHDYILVSRETENHVSSKCTFRFIVNRGDDNRDRLECFRTFGDWKEWNDLMKKKYSTKH